MDAKIPSALQKIGKKLSLGKLTFIKTRESNATDKWGVHWNEALIARDLTQNFYDANKTDPSSIKIDRSNDNSIHISAPAIFNIEELFWLGSEKTSEDVGQYGEGFKCACICLLRDFKVIPIAISGKDIYYIIQSDLIPGTNMRHLVYHQFKSQFETQTHLFLEKCQRSLAECLEQGMKSFFYEQDHPLIGENLGASNKGKVEFYKSKDQNMGYIFFQKMIRAQLPDLPIIINFVHSYKEIEKLIGNDRDRRDFSENTDKFFHPIDLYNRFYLAKLILTQTKQLWGNGKGNLFFSKCNPCMDTEITKEIYDSRYFSSSPKAANSNEKIQYKAIEDQWLLQEGRTKLPAYFSGWGAPSAKEELDKIIKNDLALRIKQESRKPTNLESGMIKLSSDLMIASSSLLRSLYDKKTTVDFTICDSQLVLGELKNNKNNYYLEIVLSSDLFLEKFSVFFSVFLHEHAHILGGDGSRSFTDGLTNIIENLINNRNLFNSFEEKFLELQEEIIVERKGETTQGVLDVSKLSKKQLQMIVKNIPRSILKEEYKKVINK